MNLVFVKYGISPLFLMLSIGLIAQEDTTKTSINFTGYLEIYYAYDFGQPKDHNRPYFLYSHDRHNEFNLNLGFVKGSYQSDKVRAQLALATGTYMNANYAAEPGVLKNIYEAYGGFKLTRNKNFWVDAGIFTSHIGFESAMSKICHALTRSILAENSPYYESGVKLTYITENQKWLFSGLFLNGWQHIQRPDSNSTPAFGTQVTYTPSEKLLINYSTFIGNEFPDANKRMRYFNNLYALIRFSEHFHLTTGFDIGFQQTAKASASYHHWFSPIVIASVLFNDHWSMALRGEYYQDENEVIIQTGTENGFQTLGYSINMDYKFNEQASWRIEARTFTSEDAIFSKSGQPTETNTAITTSLAISF